MQILSELTSQDIIYLTYYLQAILILLAITLGIILLRIMINLIKMIIKEKRK
jgi:hypothetical protein